MHIDRLKGKAGVCGGLNDEYPLPPSPGIKYLVPIGDGVTVCLERLRR